MVTKTERLFNELFSLLVLYMSSRCAKTVLAHLVLIERHRGYKGLASEITRVSKIILNAHLDKGRNTLISLLRKGGKSPVSGPLKIFYYISLRKGVKGGLDKSLQLLDFRGHIYADAPCNKNVMQKAMSVRSVVDPFERYDPITGTSSIVGDGLDYLNLFIEERLPFYVKKAISKLWGTSPDYSLPFPWDSKKSLKVRPGCKIKHHMVIPTDIIEALDQCPRLVVRNYKYVHHVMGYLLKPVDHYQQLINEQVKTNPGFLDKVGECLPLNKDRKDKIRDIFPPIWPLMLLVYPLHMRLKLILKDLSCNYCFDQDSGVDWAVKKLKEGKRLSSVDIKTASDNIPLSPQLREMSVVMKDNPWANEILDIFVSACRSQWISPFSETTYVRLLKGSTMGLPGSYYGFALHLIVLFLKASIPIEDFAVVGDDLIYESKYDAVVKAIFQKEEIPISIGKSIFDSPNLAEFCGRVITSLGVLELGKSKSIDPLNPYTTLMKYGARSLRLFGLNDEEQYLLLLLKSINQDPLDVEMLNFGIPNEQPLYQGGYTPYQYFRMGLLNRKQHTALSLLIASSFSKRGTLDHNFLKSRFSLTWGDKKAKNFRRTTHDLSQYLLTDRPTNPKWIKDMSSFDDKISMLINDNLSLLWAEATGKEHLHLSKSKPLINSWLESTLYTKYKDDPAFEDYYSSEDLAAVAYFANSVKASAPDVLISTVLPLFNNEKDPLHNAMEWDVDRLIPDQKSADLKTADRLDDDRATYGAFIEAAKSNVFVSFLYHMVICPIKALVGR